MTKFFKSNKYACVSAGIAALIMIITLFVLRLGVADNGYLTARLVSMGLYDAEGASGTGFYSMLFGIGDKTISFMPSALVYNIFKAVFPVDSVIPALLPAMIYMIFAVCGVYMIVKALTCDIKWNNILLCVFVVLIVAETGYVTFFNTPYECGAAISYFIPMMGALLMAIRYEKIRYAVIFGIFGVLFAGTMPQSGAASVIIALYSVYLALKSKVKPNKAVFALVGILIFASSMFGLSNMTNADKYNSVFYGVASSENPAYSAVLSDLKIIGKDNLAGVAYFEAEAQEFISSPEFNGVMRNVNPFNVTLMYVKNPDFMRQSLKSACNNCVFIKTEYLGNYPVSSGKASQVSGFFSLYSYVKKVLVPGSIIALAVMFVGMIFFSLDYKKKYALSAQTKNACVLCVFLTFAAIISLVIPVLYFGKAQLGFNLIIYNLIFDSLVIAAVVGGTRLLAVRRNILKEKFGVNQ
ncbi:MAG: hypothetical protein IJE46_01740 [Clostridia bacterium]|nr:hypothetical protein [Clostridia bacterium]